MRISTLYLLFYNFHFNLYKLLKLAQSTWNFIQYYTNAIKIRAYFNNNFIIYLLVFLQA